MSLNSRRISIITSLLDFIGATCTSSHIGVSEPFTSHSGAESMRHGGTCPPLLQMAGHKAGGGTVSRRTANKKLTKLYWLSRKRSPKRLIVLLKPKKVEGNDQNFFFWRFAPDRCPHFQIRSGATGSAYLILHNNEQHWSEKKSRTRWGSRRFSHCESCVCLLLQAP